jgi:hypothetical protein
MQEGSGQSREKLLLGIRWAAGRRFSRRRLFIKHPQLQLSLNFTSSDATLENRERAVNLVYLRKVVKSWHCAIWHRAALLAGAGDFPQYLDETSKSDAP